MVRMLENNTFRSGYRMLDTGYWISIYPQLVNINEIQYPETRTQDQPEIAVVFITALKFEYNFLCYKIRTYTSKKDIVK